MGRVTSAAPHLSAEEIARRLKETAGTREHRRWLIIWNALVDPREAKEIVKHTGVAADTVHDLVSRYRRFGAQAVEAPRSSKRRRCYLSKEEEVILVFPFLEKAKGGEIATAAEIRRAWRSFWDTVSIIPPSIACLNATGGERLCPDRFT